MAVIRFVYSRGKGPMQIHDQIIDIPYEGGEVTYMTLRAAEMQFIRAFTSQFGSDYLIQWESFSEDRKQRYSTYRAFIVSGRN